MSGSIDVPSAYATPVLKIPKAEKIRFAGQIAGSAGHARGNLES